VGRSFIPSDLNEGHVAVIAESLWRRRFDAAADVSGRSLSVNGQPVTVIGVMPSWFRFPSAGELPESFGFASRPEIWTLDVLTPAQQQTRGGKSFAMVARLKDGVTREQAEADLNTIAAQIAQRYPDYNAGWTVRVLPLRDQLVGGVRPALLVMLAAVGVVLLIACSNVANLLLLRAAARQREFCIRQALGAGRRRLITELLTESVALALASGALGALLAWWGLHALLALLPSTLPAVTDATLDLRVLTFTAVVAIATGIAFGLVPALQGTRCTLSDGLREGARGSVGRRSHVTRNALVIGEVAVASVLLISAALLIQTFVRLLAVETGFRTQGVLTMEIVLPRTGYSDEGAVEFVRRLTERMLALPGVLAAGATSSLPLAGRETFQPVTIQGRPRPQPGFEIVADFRAVTPGYFEALGIEQVEGEGFPRAAGAAVLLINETMARTHWPDRSAVGGHIKLASYDRDGEWYRIAGVVRDTRHASLDSSLRPQVYVHYVRHPAHQMWAVVRSAGDPAALAAAARSAVLEIDPNQPVVRVLTMPDVVAASVADRRFSMTLVGIFAALALTLSVVGLYAVISYSVAERIHEMGVRLALGAQPSNLLTMVLGEGLRLVLVGLGLGVAASLVVTRFLDTMLFGVHARDVRTFAAVVLVLSVAAMLGCLVPAWRAMRVDPMVALRAE
jgi:putative ABC transport system permease protein